MSQGSFRTAVVVCLLLLALAGGQAVLGDAPPASANGPISLRGEEQADGPVAQPPVEAKAGVEPAAPAAIEQRTLGAANGGLSVRPVDGEPSEQEATGLDAYTPGTLRVTGALAVVIGLLLLTRWALRRMGGMSRGDRPSGVLEILARYPVARGQQLVLLKFARRVLLVHQSGSAMSILTELHDRDEVASLLGRIEAGSRGAAATRFRSVLESFQREHGETPSSAQRSARNAPAGAATPPFGAEVIDLTRRGGGLFGRLAGGRR